MDQELPRKTPASRPHRRALPTEPPRRNERTGGRAAWLVPVLLLACSGDPAAPPQETPEVPVVPMAPVVLPENAVDKVVVPLLRTSGREPSVEVPEILCRRLAIDLTGATPSAAEVTQRCTGRTPAEMVDYFMSKPQAPHVPAGSVPYAYVGRRAWSEIFGYRVIEYDLTTSFYADVMELDDLVRKLYEGSLAYDRFAVEALISPAFLRRFGLVNTVTSDLTQIAATAVRIFLGREALPSDANDLGNLWRPFTLQSVGVTQARARYPQCTYCAHLAVTVRNGACGGTEALLCQSTALGPLRLGALSVPTVPVGSLPLRPSEITGAAGAELRRIGELFVRRREFAEAIVDRVLTRYLGWWLAGVYRPDYELPTVRDALVDSFIKGGYKLRSLEREVLTSVLYTQAQALRPGDITEAPLWAHGPTKQLQAEPFVDTLAAMTGVNLGGCDFRFAAGYNAQGIFDGRSRILAAYSFPTTPGLETGFYVNTVRKLGGCPGGAERGEPSGLVPAQAKREALLRICTNAVAQNTLTPRLDPALAPELGLPQLLEIQVLRLLGRQPTKDEIAALNKLAAEACPSGRCDYKAVASQLCMALLASSKVNFY